MSGIQRWFKSPRGLHGGLQSALDDLKSFFQVEGVLQYLTKALSGNKKIDEAKVRINTFKDDHGSGTDYTINSPKTLVV